MSASTPFRRMTPHVPGKLTCRTGKPPGARLSNALRAPSSRASRGMTCEFGPFFAGGAGLLGACSHFSDTLLGVNQNFHNVRTQRHLVSELSCRSRHFFCKTEY